MLTARHAILIMFTKSLKFEVIDFPLTNDTYQNDGEANAELIIRKNTDDGWLTGKNIR